MFTLCCTEALMSLGRRSCLVLRDCFSVIIVCLSARLNGFVLCSIFSITIMLIGCVPCRTIKILSESPICLPAMPAVRVPFLGSCQSLQLPCIIHESQDSVQDSPGASQSQRRSMTVGKMLLCPWPIDHTLNL